jgi:hypothetical protein
MPRASSSAYVKRHSRQWVNLDRPDLTLTVGYPTQQQSKRKQQPRDREPTRLAHLDITVTRRAALVPNPPFGSWPDDVPATSKLKSATRPVIALSNRDVLMRSCCPTGALVMTRSAPPWHLRLTCAFALSLIAATPALSWGATGHGYVSGLAIEALPVAPDGVPAFVRAPDAVLLIAELSREPDRARGAGKIHGDERDPGHYINLDDDGTVFGISPLSNIARTREEFDTVLRSRGITQYRIGYLPYTIVEGWQQLVKDFAYWRALTALIDAPDTSAGLKAWATADRRNREMLTLRDLGVWSHYVADASQPLHVSRHYDGWGVYPNPRAFTQELGLHWRIEGPFVRRHITREAIAAAIKPSAACKCPVEVRVANYLNATRAFVTDVYDLDKEGAFVVPPIQPGEPPPAATQIVTARGRPFITARLADGASELRDMIMDAWAASLEARVGYPEVAVKAIIAKPSILTPETFGVD